jgi:hypothetical protein
MDEFPPSLAVSGFEVSVLQVIKPETINVIPETVKGW